VTVRPVASAAVSAGAAAGSGPSVGVSVSRTEAVPPGVATASGAVVVVKVDQVVPVTPGGATATGVPVAAATIVRVRSGTAIAAGHGKAGAQATRNSVRIERPEARLASRPVLNRERRPDEPGRVDKPFAGLIR
jgi:hypothetical protein